MYASPELYYEIEYRQHERALENAAAYRRAAELSPSQVVPRNSVFASVVTWLRGVAQSWREHSTGGRTSLEGVVTSTSVAPAPHVAQPEPSDSRVDAVA